jgi:hypothetical protein
MIRINDNGIITDREMNDAELAVHLADVEFYKKQETEATSRAANKAALLAKLGITADEAALLLS